MSKLKEPPPARFFTGLIFSPNANIKKCLERLTNEFGKILFESNSFNFKETDYYENEMGNGLKRKFIVFKDLINRAEIIERKIVANQIEEEFSVYKKRLINIDPGYIAPEHLLLSTGKGYAHRAYLGKGVYAELTLVFEKTGIRTLEWTYPDYKFKDIQDMFLKIRKNYLKELKERNLI